VTARRFALGAALVAAAFGGAYPIGAALGGGGSAATGPAESAPEPVELESPAIPTLRPAPGLAALKKPPPPPEPPSAPSSTTPAPTRPTSPPPEAPVVIG
jgi:hypothetical protein